IKNKTGNAFRVFSPFWRCCLAQPDPAKPLPMPKHLLPPAHWPQSLRLEALELLPRINWAGGLQATWQPGEIGAAENLHSFVADSLTEYANQRNRPDIRGTSRLSPHLHFGEVSPRQVWHAVAKAASKRGHSLASFRN